MISNSQPSTLLVGIGSPHAADQLGWQAAKAILNPTSKGIDVRIAANPSDLLDWIEPYQILHVCDACRGSNDSTTVHRWLWPDLGVEHWQWSGTHDFGLPGVLLLAEELKLLPPKVVVWGLELSGGNAPEIETSMDALIAMFSDAIEAELAIHPRNI